MPDHRLCRTCGARFQTISLRQQHELGCRLITGAAAGFTSGVSP